MIPDGSSAQHSSATNAGAIQLHDRMFVPYISGEIITHAIERLAQSIEQDYRERDVVFLVVLKGALVFAADLLRCIHSPVQIEFVRASSYRGTNNTGDVRLDGSLDWARGRDIIILEDIADTGQTLTAILSHLNCFNPQSVAVAALLSKPSVHQNKLRIDYVGLEIEPVFVVGYGLDYKELGRNLPHLYRLVDE